MNRDRGEQPGKENGDRTLFWNSGVAAAATTGTRMIFCGLNDSVRITLELARVLSDAVVKNTREAAIASLIADPEPRTATRD